jgi:nicotinate-nucleotide pyrophosphorylase
VKAQPNIISVGYLTHSPKAIDYSLEIVKKT